MKVFEDAWQIKGKTLVREFNSVTNQSEVRISGHKAEYYVEDHLGKYRAFLDKSVHLRKVQGSSFNIPNAYGVKSGVYTTIREDYLYKSNNYNKDIGVFYLDIETSVGTHPDSKGFPNPEEALEPIVLIQFWSTKANKGYVLGLEDWTYRKDYQYDFDMEYIQYSNEHDLVNGYLDLFKELDPYIITAWHGDGFDFPYIHNRLKNLRIKTKRLSNHGKVELKTKKLDNGQIQNDLKTDGHWYVDTIDIYKKFVSIYEPVASMSLDFVGEKETGIGKVNHDNYVKFDDFRIGKYKILGNETTEQKAKLIHKCAVALETDLNKDKKDKYEKYIKEKSYSEFVHYGVQDFVILKGIVEKRNLIGVMVSMAEMQGCRLPDVLGTLKAWDASISATILKDGLVTPPKQDNEASNIVGGYVASPVVGKHKWILSADINSMYPLLGMTAHNLSPETYIPTERQPKEIQELIKNYYYDQDEQRIIDLSTEVKEKTKLLLKKYNLVLGLSGSVYSRESEGFIPILVKKIYADRKKAKGTMFEHEQKKIQYNKESVEYKEEDRLEQLFFTQQLTLKLAINALYGSLAMKYFSLFNEDMAKAITMQGRVYILMLQNYIRDDLQKMLKRDNYDPIIYGDTDSVYFSIEPFIDKYCKDNSLEEKVEWADRFYEKVINKSVDRCTKDFCELCNTYNPSVIGAEREVIADAGIFTAKKKYVIRVRDNEGTRYDINSPKIKVTGLEIKTSGIAPFTKKYLTEAIPLMLDKEAPEIKEWFSGVKNKYGAAHLMDIAKTIGVSKIEDPNWGKIINGRKSSPPFGSKSVITTNNYIKKNNLQEEFAFIDPGTKVKILYLTIPNPLGNSEAFAFTEGKFAERFDKYINKDINFEKFFVSPLENMVDVLKIDIKRTTEDLSEAW